MNINKLRVVSIFLSVQGECNIWGQGTWAVFVRIFNCNLACSFCDSSYTYDKDTETIEMSAQEIMDNVRSIGEGCRHITLTGGEPLMSQNKETLKEFFSLCEQNGYRISIETNGVESFVEYLDNQYISIVADYKPLSLGKTITDRIRIEQFYKLRTTDFVKFVIADKNDFANSVFTVEELRKHGCKAKMYFSPCIGKMSPEYLFKLMKHISVHSLDINYNFPIHKAIFPENDWRKEEK